MPTQIPSTARPPGQPFPNEARPVNLVESLHAGGERAYPRNDEPISCQNLTRLIRHHNLSTSTLQRALY